MDTLAFLTKILPSRGNYFIATLQQGKERPYFRHFLCESRERAAQMALHLDASGENVYHACSSFREPFVVVTDKNGEQKKRERIQDNVLLCRSFWLDLDVGSDPTKYASQKDAVIGLGEFLKATKLPVPMVVSSGNGLHCYWPLTEDILPTQWMTTARMLKDLARELKLKADPTRTADSASVLRPVGTFNKKDQPKRVEVVRDAPLVSFRSLFESIESAARAQGVAKSVPREASAAGANAKFLVQSDYPDAHASLVADRCPQIRAVRDTGGSVPEPIWYGAIQLLFHTVEKEQVIHAWSSGYTGYSPEETNRKIDQIRSMGPTTCATFQERNPDGCIGCPFKGKITSPIQLGVQRESLPAPAVTLPASVGVPEIKLEIPNPPHPFVRTKDGVFMEMEGGLQVRVVDYDLFPVEACWDEHLNCETLRMRYLLPNEDPKDFSIPTFLLAAPQEFAKEMRKNCVQPRDTKLLMSYADEYLRSIKKTHALKKLVMQMGWKDEYKSFVLGRKVFNRDGSVQYADLSDKSNRTIHGFAPKGSAQTWIDSTEGLGESGLEAHAFSLLLGFGAPLLTFLGHHGITFSMLGASGAGKSTMAWWQLSIWGDPEQLKIGHDDTELSKLERFGTYCNLPLYIDEFSNMKPEDMSRVAYAITRGEGRRRLRQDATERPTLSWSTFLTVSTNQSLLEKLQANKSDARAESFRVFEYDVPHDNDRADFWKRANYAVRENYGHAGETFIHYVVQNVSQVRDELRAFETSLGKLAKCNGEERFWLAGVACAIYGGMVAQKLGLLKFDLGPVTRWAVKQLGILRMQVADRNMDDISLLGAYLDEFATNRIVVYGSGNDTKLADPVKQPNGAIYQRLELDTGKLYISRKHLADQLQKRGVNYNTFRDSLRAKGILTDINKRICMGKGTGFASVQVHAWEINTKHAALMDHKLAEEIEA